MSLHESEITDEFVVCSRHWPEGTAMIKHFGKDRPVDPPTVFNGIEKVLPPLRTTTKSLAEARRPLPVSFEAQQSKLKEVDSITFQSLKTKLIEEKKPLPAHTTVFMMA